MRPTTPQDSRHCRLRRPRWYLRGRYLHGSPKVGSAAEFLEALSAGEVRPAGEEGSGIKFTHPGFRVAGEAIKKGESDRGEGALRRLVAMSPPLPGLRRF